MMNQAQKIRRVMYGPSCFENIVVYSCGVVLGLVVGLAICNIIETTFFPVVTDFKLTYFEKTSDGVVVSGSMNKHRSCKLISTNVYGHNNKHGKTLLFTFKGDHNLAQMSTGKQSWGPVSIKLYGPIDAETIVVEAVHQCHPLWQQETNYGSIDARTLR